MNTCNHPIDFEGFSVVLCKKNKQESLLKCLKDQALFITQKKLMILQKKWPPFPYLKVKDQVLLNLSENKEELSLYQEKLKIDPLLLNKDSEQLILFDKIKLQLLHALLAKKEKIIIEDFLDLLSISEKQELLYLLADLVKKHKIAVLLLTHEESIAYSPYVNHLRVEN
ncbi:hypothetical protein ACTNBL_13705 [Enterococcus villorum]|uniref:ABC transporter ATP-binding protein n=2 Tax=Enterococcus villorum TaxID=112904 RepID=A0A511J4U7_9ENTE|nr:hypothetical protein [Enterococcus villorum]EOH86427.1 hypothetical protein UAO_02424 [Enterococcus villorum ATCC 700913]EOW78884.1 hypothetical protein I591_00427 [Enterococcus villorum ATCC 700913]GEL93022.1 hypothetical protein EVI01_23590 [Enterococcus villorum]